VFDFQYQEQQIKEKKDEKEKLADIVKPKSKTLNPIKKFVTWINNLF
jgi:hypothetical protein